MGFERQPAGGSPEELFAQPDVTRVATDEPPPSPELFAQGPEERQLRPEFREPLGGPGLLGLVDPSPGGALLGAGGKLAGVLTPGAPSGGVEAGRKTFRSLLNIFRKGGPETGASMIRNIARSPEEFRELERVFSVAPTEEIIDLTRTVLPVMNQTGDQATKQALRLLTRRGQAEILSRAAIQGDLPASRFLAENMVGSEPIREFTQRSLKETLGDVSALRELIQAAGRGIP